MGFGPELREVRPEGGAGPGATHALALVNTRGWTKRARRQGLVFVLVSVKQYAGGGLVASSWQRGRREAAGTAMSGAPQ